MKHISFNVHRALFNVWSIGMNKWAPCRMHILELLEGQTWEMSNYQYLSALRALHEILIILFINTMKCQNHSQTTHSSRPIQAWFFHQGGSVLTDLPHHNLLLSLFSTPLICLWIIRTVGWWNFKHSEDFFSGRYFEHWQRFWFS